MKRSVIFWIAFLIPVGIVFAELPKEGSPAGECMTCHKEKSLGLYNQWYKSEHAKHNVTCLDCHLVQPGDQDVAQDHEKYYSRSDMPWGETRYKMPIASIVTPKDCSRCHQTEFEEMDGSHHSKAGRILGPRGLDAGPRAAYLRIKARRRNAPWRSRNSRRWSRISRNGFPTPASRSSPCLACVNTSCPSSAAATRPTSRA